MLITCITPTIRGDKGLEKARQSLKKQEHVNFEWIVKRHNPNHKPDFNKAMNEALREAKGDIIVFLQDYIEILPVGLRLFELAHRRHPKTFFTSPVGKTLDDDNIAWDWRVHRENDSSVNFMEWEIDWGSAPRKALIEIGGFDEALDKHWGFDNVNVGMRAEMAGYKFRCDPNNVAVAFDHDKKIEHPYRKLINPDFHNERLDEIRQGLKIKF